MRHDVGESTALVEVVKWASGLGTPTLLILVLIGGYRQWWVWGWQLREMREDRDFWRAQALGVTAITQTATQNHAVARKSP